MEHLGFKFKGQKLTKEQMKSIKGGDDYNCYLLDSSGNHTGDPIVTPAANCCQAQAIADGFSWGVGIHRAPYGMDCPCDIDCDA